MYADYPWWRHAAFGIVDASIASLAVRRPARLFFPLLAFFVEQVATNGIDAREEWLLHHRVQWLVLVTLPLILAAVIAVAPSSLPLRGVHRVG
jgi:hypothetical protein